jgi:dUTP pyrophosphatase
MNLKVKKLHKVAKLPMYATKGAAGFDFYALADIEVWPGEIELVRTGLAFEIPEGFEIQIRPRSGMTLNTPLRVANAPGTVDSDFRGEVFIMVQNMGSESYVIAKGERIAQGVLVPVLQAKFIQTKQVKKTKRGKGALGSTGTR